MFKFAIDQKVYFIKNNNVHCATVCKRQYQEYTPRQNAGINSNYVGKTIISYMVSNGDSFEEDSLFANESGLFAHMTKNMVIDKAAV